MRHNSSVVLIISCGDRECFLGFSEHSGGCQGKCEDWLTKVAVLQFVLFFITFAP